MKAAYDSGDLDVKRQVLEIVKRRVVNDYFIVGILEQFEDTLQLFETMLPMFYKGAMDAWKSDCKSIDLPSSLIFSDKFSTISKVGQTHRKFQFYK